MPFLTDTMRQAVDARYSARVTSRAPDGGRQDATHAWLTVLDDRTLAIAAVEPGPTVDNLVETPAVDVTVVDPATGSGFRCSGTARVLLSGPTFDRLGRLFSARGLQTGFEHIVFVDVRDVVTVGAGR